MDRRYQVFISSTFSDLTEERAAVATAVQQCNHIPAGMELFPSGNNPPWDIIERVIKTSDYYAVVVGGRYGSRAEDGLSWTEKEYELALSLGIPVLPFIHADRNALVRSADVDPESRERLDAFIDRLKKSHTVKEWSDSGDLASKVLVALIYEFAQNPRPGWIRGDVAFDRDNILQTLENVRTENDKLKEQIEHMIENQPQSAPSLFADGDKKIKFVAVRAVQDHEQEGLGAGNKPQVVEEEFSETWFRIFNAIAWDALSGATPDDLIRNVWKLAPKGSNPKDAKKDWRRIATQLLANELIDVRSELRPERARMKAFTRPIMESTSGMVSADVWYLTEKGKRLYAIINAVAYRGAYEVSEAVR